MKVHIIPIGDIVNEFSLMGSRHIIGDAELKLLSKTLRAIGKTYVDKNLSRMSDNAHNFLDCHAGVKNKNDD
jgi:hypothetical protein